LERFLQSCAEDNIQVCNLTTPAQYFHVLRRQIRRSFRKPLVIMTPKSMLRHKLAVSNFNELTEGTFCEVLEDTGLKDPKKVQRVAFCSGKIYYDLLEYRGDRKDVALVRIEQLYPFPEETVRAILSRYPDLREVVWVQEESQNMGAWSFIEPRLRTMGYTVSYIGRDASASPATGSKKIHDREQKELVAAVFQPSVPHVVGNSNGTTTRPVDAGMPEPALKS